MKFTRPCQRIILRFLPELAWFCSSETARKLGEKWKYAVSYCFGLLAKNWMRDAEERKLKTALSFNSGLIYSAEINRFVTS